MVNQVTEAIVDTLNCKLEKVQIIIHEISQDQIANGGILKCDQE